MIFKMDLEGMKTKGPIEKVLVTRLLVVFIIFQTENSRWESV